MTDYFAINNPEGKEDRWQYQSIHCFEDQFIFSSSGSLAIKKYIPHLKTLTGHQKQQAPSCFKVHNSVEQHSINSIIMVTVINYKKRQAEDGREFFALEVQGGIEMVQSQTGNFYATARKSSITSTFDEMTCTDLIGTQIPGNIEKIECDPYQYTVKDTGDVIMLHHRYTYQPEGVSTVKQKEMLAKDMEIFSGIKKTEAVEN